MVAVTKTNAIFGIADNSIEKMRPDESAVTYIFSGYDGTVFIRGYGKLAWHGIPYRESKLQQIPKWFRQYPKNYSDFKKTTAKLYRSLVKRNIL